MTFYERPIAEQELIRNAYELEMQLLESNSAESNPYLAIMKNMPDGKILINAVNEAVEMA